MTEIKNRPTIPRLVAAGLVVTELALPLCVLLFAVRWALLRRVPSFQQAPLLISALVLLAAYWLAIRFIRFFSDQSGAGVRLPRFLRQIVAWFVVAMSYLLGYVPLTLRDALTASRWWKSFQAKVRAERDRIRAQQAAQKQRQQQTTGKPRHRKSQRR